ncbi:hypothetical protein HFC69_00295 [Pediococcus sp. EKM202D]|uniref:hypothetical protein n=1 Tax=unclassified Pediococcus TaxID=554805 RepID=UPI00142DB89E|nr:MULTISPECIES: hypothetical protein [unclassified Pediococcus]KAF5440731.1 hypothetical protein HFC69_00295 [Pediococcus sp. EKM202D]KAF5441706.1 hypothetical protein HFC68_02585 [Pediococcus sp. EKM201D]
MTKDEFNGILKEEGMCLAFYRDGTKGNGFNILDNRQQILVKCNGLDIFYSSEYAFNKYVIEAMISYINSSIEERKPKPQLYNVVIGRDLENTGFYTAWVNAGGFRISGSVSESMLYDKSQFKFTKEEIEKYKSRLSPIEQAIVDLGIFPVGTDYKKEFAHE